MRCPLTLLVILFAMPSFGCLSSTVIGEPRGIHFMGLAKQFVGAVNEGKEAEALACWRSQQAATASAIYHHLRSALDQASGENPRYVIAELDDSWTSSLKAEIKVYAEGTPITEPLWCEEWNFQPSFRNEIWMLDHAGIPVPCP